jgi:hypothetical protein
MPEMIKCSKCNAPLRVPEHLLGKEVRCPSCQSTFTAGAGPEPTSSPESEPQQLAQSEETSATPGQQRVSERPPRPNRRYEQDDDFDDEDHPRRPRRRDHYRYGDRGGMVLTFGIVSTVFILISCFFALLFGILPVGIIGVGTGVAAWILGRKDLAAIENGDRDPRGYGMTNAGMICGIIGTIVNGLLVLLQCGIVLLGAVIWAAAAAAK